MRIALVAPLVSALKAPQIGGVATLLTDLAEGIQGEGHEVTIFAASGSQVDGLDIVDTGVHAEELSGTLYRPLAAPPNAATAEALNALSTRAFGQVYEQVAAGSFDIVHNHSFDAPAIALATGLGCPVVHTLHLPPDPAISRTLARAQADSTPPVVAAVSETQLRSWRRHNRIDVLLRAGIPTERIRWSEEHQGGLLLAGRISPEKGVLDAIEIAGAAGRELTIAGYPYDRSYAAEVDRAVARVGGVTYAGSLNREQLWQLMAGAAALLLPIRWEEPFGLVAAEAQAAGCPVVGYRRGSLSDVIAEGLTGIAVPEGTVAAAAAAVEEVLGFDRLTCRLHAEKYLDLAPTIEAHMQLYAELARR